jgi:predicted ArsR family transcriptional regulator
VKNIAARLPLGEERAVLDDQDGGGSSVRGTALAVAGGADRRTRDRVTQLLLSHGAATAAELGDALSLSPAAIRRHLDAMTDDGDVVSREQVVRGPRGRGRPARVFALTDAARVRAGTHTYDDLASSALRWIAREGGPAAVAAFAAEQVATLEMRCRDAIEGAGDEPLARAEALAGALTAEGYAASATVIATGGQLCQHHCPVAHVAAEFPQLCEAETQAISKLMGTHVQRLATIAHGDGVCTTHIPDPRHIRDPREPRHVADRHRRMGLPTGADRPATRNAANTDAPHSDVPHTDEPHDAKTVRTTR